MVEVYDHESHVVEEFGISTTWHQRLGHISEMVMEMLVFNGRIPYLKIVIVDLCKQCVLGK